MPVARRQSNQSRGDVAADLESDPCSAEWTVKIKNDRGGSLMTISQGEPLRLYGTLLGKRSTGIAEWYFTR